MTSMGATTARTRPVDQSGRPDVSAVLGGLKDFQRKTVDYVFRRMYLDTDVSHRFLVADEVGLGKTLVARGVIARAIDHLWNTVPRIDIVYICSNADIARQNVNRLQIGNEEGFALTSRITLLPTKLHDLESHKLNFISFTPGTSFNLHSSGGRMEERVLLYWLLRRAWGLSGALAPMNVLQGGAGHETFRNWVEWYENNRPIDQTIARDFTAALEQRMAHKREIGEPDLRTRFNELCLRFSRTGRRVNAEDRRLRDRFVGELRALLATTCLRALEPDLIILDEFQRFKHLLHGDDDASQLARELFEYSNEHSKARVLLLSATPYKMYTLADEAGNDDHFADFVNTVRFLQPEADATRFARLLREYRSELYRLGDGGGNRLLALKAKIETDLRRVMVRTERLAVSEERDGMLVHRPAKDLTLEMRDVEAYCALQLVARSLGAGDTIEYWKSAPYLLNFMEGYDIKRKVDHSQHDAVKAAAVATALSGAAGLLLNWEDVSRYEAIDPANARLRSLAAATLGRGAWRLLWIPPSLPYYQPEGPFADTSLARFTKRLVFSSWRVVPKVIATLLSYEAERQMLRTFEEAPENSLEARRRRRGLLRFARTDGRLAGMPVLGLLYPSITLARTCDPTQLAVGMADERHGPGSVPLARVLGEAALRIESLLAAVPDTADEGSAEDEAWYWAAPILLDLAHEGAAARAWLSQQTLELLWSGETSRTEDDGDESLWAEHVAEARLLLNGQLQLGRRPADLTAVLAHMALAAPGVVTLRALSRVTGGAASLVDPNVRTSAGQAAWAFRSLFNHPEVMALLRAEHDQSPYWRRTLEYGAQGNIQAVLDEYAHVLRELLGLFDKPASDTAKGIAGAMRQALTLRTSSLSVDVIEPHETKFAVDKKRMRTRFALGFGVQRSEDDKEGARVDQVRDAFNSPFWPFVLATTSVGQEGLDFHPYCHAVVHWNLPANPVDLEQREGRVHRYKGHAVRRNLARKYGTTIHPDGHADVWQALFDQAKQERPADTSDLVPYWVYPVEGGEKIERYVPALPLSRDAERYEALRKSLAVYRMVFGQPRQEDLVAYLLTRLSREQIEQMTDELRIDLSPPDDIGLASSSIAA